LHRHSNSDLYGFQFDSKPKRVLYARSVGRQGVEKFKPNFGTYGYGALGNSAGIF